MANNNLGKKVREYRIAKELTLAELAKQSGVALSTLSRIETGKMTGTLESHIQIARALGARLPELYAELDPLASALEHRTGTDSSTRIHSGKGALLTILTSNALHRKMLPALIQLPAGKSTKTEQTSPGVERFLYALKGKTEVTVGSQRVRMNAGDSLYFQAANPHSFKNTGGGQALLLSLTSPPSV
jgi:transcriptional regulator with XRE-family HTH domain